MKRLFGLIGLTYLSVLTVVYYLYSKITVCVLLNLSAGFIITGLIFEIIRRNYSKFKVKIGREFMIAGTTAVCACLALVIFTNGFYNPVISKYCDKELKIEGYICDEVIYKEDRLVYPIETTQIDGTVKNIRLNLTSYGNLKLEAFDCVSLTACLYADNSNYSVSRRTYFRAYADSEGFEISKTGEKYFSIYSLAVSLREKMKNSFDLLLPQDYSSLCKAVLIGDKNSLSNDIKEAFTDTGVSFLIVVSGYHLSVITAFALFLLRKITKNRIIISAAAAATVLAFMAVTGFTPSVVRAGVLNIIVYFGMTVLRKADSLNSMGIAALVLTLPNPYAVADVGMLLSFSATIGIILWSGKIFRFFKNRTSNFFKGRKIHRLLKYLFGQIAVSVSASIWVMPITILAFGTISPLVIVVSLLTELTVSLLIVFSLITCVFCRIPFASFIAYPFALLCALIGKYIIFVVRLFAKIPYSSLNADKTYFYAEIIIFIILVILGYIIKAKRKFVYFSISLLLCITVAGSAADCFTQFNCAEIRIFNVGSGVSACVCKNGNALLISCGGSSGKESSVIDYIADRNLKLHNIVLPDNRNVYSRYQSKIIDRFDADNILVYDIDRTTLDIMTELDGKNRFKIYDNMNFGLEVAPNLTDNILSIDGTVYQLIKSENTSALFIPKGGDASLLSEEFLNAEYVLIDSIPKNAHMLNCKTLIYSGDIEHYQKIYNDLTGICNNIKTTTDEDIVISLNGG